jgi:hypothetical protein
VLAEILRERFAVPRAVFGGLIVYAAVNTMIPGLLLKLPPPEFEEPHAHELPAAEATAVGYVPAPGPRPASVQGSPGRTVP